MYNVYDRDTYYLYIEWLLPNFVCSLKRVFKKEKRKYESIRVSQFTTHGIMFCFDFFFNNLGSKHFHNIFITNSMWQAVIGYNLGLSLTSLFYLLISKNFI